jgi:predicted Zn-dependent protease
MHELGHALGLLQHSPDTTDLMHSSPRVRAPSDRRSVEVLYHTEPTIAPKP